MNITRAVTLFVLCLTLIEAQGQITGSGTAGRIALWTGTNTLGNSIITQHSGTLSLHSPATAITASSSGTSAGISAVLGQSTAFTGTVAGVRGTILSSTANATGVLGTAHSGNGFVFGVTGSSGSQEGAGVYGVNFAFGGDGGSGVLGYAGATAGPVWGVKGYANSTDGIGVQGSAPFEGLVGVAQTCKTTCLPTAGTAGVFTTGSGGNIVVGNVADVNNNLTPVFRVDSTGKGFFDGGTQTGGADFAESMAIAGPKNHYEPGDLLAVDSSANRQLTLTTQPYSTLVAGIYSTKPGVLASTHKMKSSESEKEIPLAVVGIVPCKASAENGPIEPGNLLVASSTPGRAMKGTDRNRMLGAVVGKALEPLREGKGVVQVLVTLQ